MLSRKDLILAPASIWKRSHDYHHQHNSKLFSADIGSYPIVTNDRLQRDIHYPVFHVPAR